MKTLLSLAVALIIAGCNKNENAWDSLTDAEKSYLATRASQECMASTTDGFREFKEKSREAYLKFERSQNWKYEFKKPDGTETVNYMVWKVDAKAVYFLLKNTVGDSNYTFLKVPEDINEEMIDELKSRKCKREFTYSHGGGKSKTSTEAKSKTAENEHTKIVQKYSYSHTELAYFGMLRSTRKIEKFDDKDKLIKDSTQEFTGALTSQTAVKPLYKEWNTYEAFQPGKVRYCIIRYNETNSVRSFPMPYALNCEPTVEEFDKTTELCFRSPPGSCSFPD